MNAIMFTHCILIAIIGTVYGSKPYCEPSNVTCWPAQTQINDFSSSLDGQLILFDLTNHQYIEYVNFTNNLYCRSFPSFIASCTTHSDVQKSVKFAKSHNLQITIISTGHSYQCKCSANNSLQINLSNLKAYSINNAESSMTVETGLVWGDIYKIVNDTYPFTATIIGGSEFTVGPGGFSMGGGHNPQTPRYGLASDHTLQYYLVNADGDIITASNNSYETPTNPDLFWALRGGGGSTFGVVLNITFELIKLAQPPSENVYTWLGCVYPLTVVNSDTNRPVFVGDTVINNFFDFIHSGDMDPLWSGYFLAYSYPGTLQFGMNYYGNSTYAKENIMPMMQLDPYSSTTFCVIEEFSNFYDLELNTIDPDPTDNGTTYLYIYDMLIPSMNLTTDLTTILVEFLNNSNVLRDGWVSGWDGVLVGGNNNLNNFPYGYTAVNKGFREAEFVFNPCIGWSDDSITQSARTFAQNYETKMRPFGNGIYSNEENGLYNTCDDCDWKTQFWGNENYDRLLEIKQKYDGNQVFWCQHCVGSDL